MLSKPTSAEVQVHKVILKPMNVLTHQAIQPHLKFQKYPTKKHLLISELEGKVPELTQDRICGSLLL